MASLSVRRTALNPRRALALGIAILTISIGLCATAYAGVVTTGSLLKTTKAAIASQPGVHVAIAASSSSTSTSEQIIADVGTTSGAETIIEGKAEVAVKVTATDGYVSGNSSGLTKIFGLSSADAKKVGTEWVSWKAGTSQYINLKSSLTISAVTALLPKAKGTRLSTNFTTGTQLYVLKWTTATTSSTPKLSITLTLSGVGATLPVEQTVTTSGGTKETTTFSQWGEHVVVKAPSVADTVTSSKITG
jgi:hypothetical protein